MLEFMPHTADVRLKVSSETLPELFQQSLKGMNDLLKHGFCDEIIENSVYHSVDIEAFDTTVLLIDFLSEVLTLSNIHQALLCNFTVTTMSDHQISGDLSGAQVDEFDSDIKAVTYHEADVHLNETGEFETVIIFDL
jgi:SHS2 domain-containing protein